MKFLKTIIALFLICAGLTSCTDQKEKPQKTYSILFTENPVMVGANGGTVSCTFISDHQWTAESVSDWITDVSVSGSQVSFSVEENPTEDTRNGKIRFCVVDDEYTYDLTIRQVGNTGKLTVEKTDVTLSTVGEKMEIKISSGENWSVSAPPMQIG